MNNSKNSLDTLRNKEVKIPLKGFMVEVESPRAGWKVLHEGMGDGRIRIHMTKIRK